MNRKQRRQLEKKRVTAKDLKVIEDHSKSRGIDAATTGILASLALTLHDKWGWGHVRITRLLNQIDEQFDAVNKGFVPLEDLLKTVRDELGVDFR
jgi:hypothetical protein